MSRVRLVMGQSHIRVPGEDMTWIRNGRFFESPTGSAICLCHKCASSFYPRDENDLYCQLPECRRAANEADTHQVKEIHERIASTCAYCNGSFVKDRTNQLYC